MATVFWEGFGKNEAKWAFNAEQILHCQNDELVRTISARAPLDVSYYTALGVIAEKKR